MPMSRDFAWPGDPGRDGPPVDRDCAGHAAQDAEEGEQQGFLSLSVETAEPDDLACANLERNALETVLPTETLDLERRRWTRAAWLGRILGRDVPPDHQLDDLRGRAGALVEGFDVAAVAEHRGAVGQRLDFVHAVRDVEDGDVLSLQPGKQRIDPLDVGAGERRSRLVEDQKLRLLAERLGDLDHLAAR